MALDKTGIDAIQDRYRTLQERFYTKTFVDPMLNQYMIVTTRDETVLPSATVQKGLQSYQAGHHSKGGITFTGRKLQMEQAKFDLTFETGRFSTNYYYSYMKRNGNNPREFPYQDFIIQLILDQLYEDYTLDAQWNGKNLGPIANAPNNPGDIADGFFELLLAMIVAGSVTVTPTGAITSSNAVAKIEQFVWDTIGQQNARRKRPHYLYCSSQTYLDYLADWRDTYGTLTYATDPFTGNAMVAGTQTVLVPQDGMDGDALVLARPDNLHVGFDGPPWLELDYSSRQLKVEIDWKFGQQFQSGLELEVNEWAMPS